MIMVSIRLPQSTIDDLKDYAKKRQITKQEAYREIIAKGLKIDNSEIKIENKINEIVARNSIESKYFMQQIYRNTFDQKTSKYETPDDEFSDIRQEAIDLIENLKNKNKE